MVIAAPVTVPAVIVVQIMARRVLAMIVAQIVPRPVIVLQA